MMRAVAGALLALAVTAGAAAAQEETSDRELAKQLANPVSSLISVPFQFNYDCCYNADHDDPRYTVNVQPVVPIALNANWNLIVRTILPIVYASGDIDHAGFGDTTQSFFFSPRSHNGFTWAVGPALYYPTGTDDLSAAKWGAGPTALALREQGHATYGVLFNHIWSVAGDDSHADFSNTFIQPFFSYTLPDTTGISINSESTYDWKHDQWTVPINVGVNHLYAIHGQRVQLGATARAYLDAPSDGPDWGLRFNATLLFPQH